MMMQCQPIVANSRCTRRSRRRFLSIFFVQNVTLLLGRTK
ncbi:hypothetical protein EVA_14139 [gut metagenome]|uniref:Uncharacterized protein n=1 Tax=gut metagenome TaxID=749906 RepID=J9CCR6_9ZZZZ